jgi:hypothetical protein
MSDFNSLSEMYGSREYAAYISEKLGNALFINDPERAERIAEYAEDGINGSTHRETIGDWQEFLDSLKIFDPDYEEIEDIAKYDLTKETYNSIQEEIIACEQWHVENGSIDNTGA